MPEDRTRIEQSKRQMSFNFFHQDRLLPVLNGFNNRNRREVEGIVAAEVLESFLWLHHGVGIAYFPEEESRFIMYENFPLFLKALGESWERADFETRFTSPLRTILENEFAGNTPLFSSGYIWQSSAIPADATSMFQSLLILANGFAQNQSARPLLELLVGSSEPNWTQQFPIADDLLSAFLSFLDFMQAYRQIISTQRQTFSDATKKMQDFLRILKETKQWRLNCGYPRYRDRFIEVGRIAAEAYVQFLPRTANFDQQAEVNSFMEQLRDLMTDWGAPNAMVATG